MPRTRRHVASSREAITIIQGWRKSSSAVAARRVGIAREREAPSGLLAGAELELGQHQTFSGSRLNRRSHHDGVLPRRAADRVGNATGARRESTQIKGLSDVRRRQRQEDERRLVRQVEREARVQTFRAQLAISLPRVLGSLKRLGGQT